MDKIIPVDELTTRLMIYIRESGRRLGFCEEETDAIVNP